MKVNEEIDLSPDEKSGGWTVSYEGLEQHYENLNDAVEGLLELTLVIAIHDKASAQQVGWDAVHLKDALEAYRHMVMTWYQTQIPDTHAVTNLNRLDK